jgi:hypothetical protein
MRAALYQADASVTTALRGGQVEDFDSDFLAEESDGFDSDFESDFESVFFVSEPDDDPESSEEDAPAFLRP